MGKMLGQTLSSCQSILRIVVTIVSTVLPPRKIYRSVTTFVAESLYILLNTLPPKYLKLFRLPILLRSLVIVSRHKATKGRVVESADTRTYRKRQARTVGLITLGADWVVADEAQTYCPRLEGLVLGSETEVSTYL